MTLSLVQQTVANASGTYTPNALITGFWELHQTGTLHIAAPSNVSDGQLLAIRIQQDIDDPGWAITWASAYAAGGGNSLADGYLTQDSSKDHLFFCTNGRLMLFSSAIDI